MQVAELYSLSAEWVLAHALSVLAALAILVAGWVLAALLAGAVAGALPASAHIDRTIRPLLSQILRYAILILTVVLALSQLGVQTASMLAVLGAAGLAVALALQGTLSNLAAGIMLVWLRPLAVGEQIEGDGLAGTVLEVGLFGTRLKTADGLLVFTPNSRLWNAAITNYSREPTRRLELRVAVPHARLGAARDTLLAIAAEARALPLPAPVVHVEELGDATATLLLRAWVPTAEYESARFALTELAGPLKQEPT